MTKKEREIARKTINRKQHAINRAKERLGIELTFKQYQALSARVRTGTFLSRHNEAEVWRIEVQGKVCDVLYDPKGEFIASFLPTKTVGQPKSPQTQPNPAAALPK
jgi:hypothetical protein